MWLTTDLKDNPKVSKFTVHMSILFCLQSTLINLSILSMLKKFTEYSRFPVFLEKANDLPTWARCDVINNWTEPAV